MGITLSLEQQRVVERAIQTGAIRSVDEFIAAAVESLACSAVVTSELDAAPVDQRFANLSDLLLNSPFAGSNLDLERSKDVPGPVGIE